MKEKCSHVIKKKKKKKKKAAKKFKLNKNALIFKKKKKKKKKAANNFKDLRSITLSFSSGVTCFVAEKGKGIKKF